jgi:hypothetical protein
VRQIANRQQKFYYKVRKNRKILGERFGGWLHQQTNYPMAGMISQGDWMSVWVVQTAKVLMMRY